MGTNYDVKMYLSMCKDSKYIAFIINWDIILF